MATSPNELITRAAAEYLGISKQTLANWASTGRYELPYVRLGGRVRYRREDLDAFIQRRTITHTGQL